MSVAVLLAVLVTLALADPEPDPHFGRGGFGRGGFGRGGFGRGGFGRGGFGRGGFGRGGFGRGFGGGGFGRGGFGRGGFGRGGFGGFRGRRSVDAEMEATEVNDAFPYAENFDDISLVLDRLRREASPAPEPQRGQGFGGGDKWTGPVHRE